jgi:FAD/FMN-containing dehydrogenase
MNQQAPRVITSARKVWENWHETVRQKAERLVTIWNAQPNQPSIASYNATTTAIQGLIAEALAGGLHLRAAGGTWSFTPVAATDGIILNTLALNYPFWPAAADLHPSQQANAGGLIFAQCGVSVSQLSTVLERRGRSLHTSGASNGQTIAGAIGTGTHGSALQHGGIHDSVVALHIVTAPDRHVWLERATEPVASQTFIDSLGAELVADDALFDAALVSLGGFGIVHGVMLDTAPLFWLKSYRRQYREDAGVRAAVGELDFSALAAPEDSVAGRAPYFFQAIYNPYDRAGGPYLSRMYDFTSDPGGQRPPRDDKFRPGDGAAEAIALLTDLSGGAPPAIGNFLVGIALPNVNGDTGTWAEQFWDTSTRGRSAGLAFGIPLERALEGVDVLYELNAEFRVPGVFALRYVQASRATLAFTRHAPITCVLEVDGPRSKRMESFYQAAPAVLESHGIPFTFHWGKMHSPAPQLVQQMYGPAVAVWRQQRAALLPPPLRTVFSNEFMESCGL